MARPEPAVYLQAVTVAMASGQSRSGEGSRTVMGLRCGRGVVARLAGFEAKQAEAVGDGWCCGAS